MGAASESGELGLDCTLDSDHSSEMSGRLYLTPVRGHNLQLHQISLALNVLKHSLLAANKVG